jgi:hypothetical protein
LARGSARAGHMREIVSVRHRTQERAMSEHVQLRYGVLRRRSDVGSKSG